MRIGIDVSPLSGGHAGRGTGIYTKELLSSLRKYTDLNVQEIQRRDDRNDVDIVHFPYFDPFLLTLPFRKDKPTIVTIHDLIPIVHADHFPRGLRGEIKWQIQKRSAQSVQAIITDSESSKKDIVRLLPFPEKHVHVVYLAPSLNYSPQSLDRQKEVLKKFNLEKPFVLYVGDVNWNKNIPALIKAMKTVDEELVFVGKAFLDETLPEVVDINKTIATLGLKSRVRKLGFVESFDLASLYSAAGAYVQPSIAEGFGFPVLEAMACGTVPVISSTTSLPEIGGPSIQFDPYNVNQMSEAINTALQIDKKTIQKELTTWVKRFSWEKTAQETATVYRNYC